MKKKLKKLEEKDYFDKDGNQIAERIKRVLCYSSDIGKHRIYRQNFYNIEKGMKVFEYKTLKNAQKLCDEINKAYNDDFIPVLKEEK